MNPLGVVVIGRNEGDRLLRCFDSLEPQAVPVVYVDSGSTDGSVEAARARGVEVVELDPSRPFSAARARNEGFARLERLCPVLRFVMFVDGDCEVDSDWLPRAVRELEARPELAVVCGRRRELHPERSVYNRLADLEWNTPIGPAQSCGGDALFRVADFKGVGGFDPTAKAGEEPELCRRLRRAGRQIARIDAEMTRHDLNMTRFSEWWRRQFRVGYHGLDIESRFQPIAPSGGTAARDSLFGPGLRRARVWGIGWPSLVAAAAVLMWSFVGVVPALWSVLAGFVLPAAQAGRLAWRIRRRVDRPRDAIVFGGLSVLEKWANLAGQVQYLRDKGRGRGAQLIEYKGRARPAPAHRAG